MHKVHRTKMYKLQGQTVQSAAGAYTFSDRSNETVFETKSRRDALKIAQDASPGISRRRRGSPVGTFEAARSVPYASLAAFDPVPFCLWSKTHNGQIGLHGYAPSCFLLRAPFHTSLRDCFLTFFRIPRVPPGLQSNRPYGTKASSINKLYISLFGVRRLIGALAGIGRSARHSIQSAEQTAHSKTYSTIVQSIC